MEQGGTSEWKQSSCLVEFQTLAITSKLQVDYTVLYRAHRCHRSIVNFNMLTALYRSLITLHRLLINLCSTSQSAQFEIWNSMILLYLNLRQQKTTIKVKYLIWLFEIPIQINYATCKISISGFKSLVSKPSVERDQGANMGIRGGWVSQDKRWVGKLGP